MEIDEFEIMDLVKAKDDRFYDCVGAVSAIRNGEVEVYINDEPVKVNPEDLEKVNRENSLEEVFEAIKNERQYQDQKWGTIEENSHIPKRWIEIMENELKEAKSEIDLDSKLLEILQVVSVGVACLEQHGLIERFE